MRPVFETLKNVCGRHNISVKLRLNSCIMMKVSVITVAYNSGATIADTLESVLNQTYNDIECIVVDGKSRDNTMDIVKSFIPRFGGRIKVLSEKDEGIYDAMNKGICMSTGDVVGILNSDDYFTSPDVVEKMVSAFSDGVDAVYGDVHFIRDSRRDVVVRYYSSRPFRRFMLRFGFMPAHPSLYVRREVYDRVGLYKTNYHIGSDFEMMVRLFHTFRINTRYIPLDFVTMRMGGRSTKDISSRRTLLREDTMACRENGIRTNQLVMACKYVFKIMEYRPAALLK